MERRMKTVLMVALAAMVALPAVADTQVVKRLKACGVEAKNAFGSHVELPAVNEGGGYVGFLTVDEDSTGTRQRFSLVNCATRGITQVKVDYKLADAKTTLEAGGDLATYVASLRKQGQLANEAAFAKLARQAGYPVGAATLGPRGSADTTRSDCGCQLYYPDLFYSN